MSESLLLQIAGGDQTAFERLLDRYGSLVWSLALRMCRNQADAEDATQEIMLEVWKSAHRYDPRLSAEPTFVTLIARRRLLDRMRKVGRRPLAVTLEDDLVNHQAEDPAAAASDSDQAQLAVRYLSQLKDEEIRVLKLAIYEHLSQGEISSVLNMPLGTVKSHARRGLQKLREMMQRHESLSDSPESLATLPAEQTHVTPVGTRSVGTRSTISHPGTAAVSSVGGMDPSVEPPSLPGEAKNGSSVPPAFGMTGVSKNRNTAKSDQSESDSNAVGKADLR